MELHKFSQDGRRDGIEDFTYTRIPPLLLLISKWYSQWYPSKTNWAEGKEAFIFVSAMDTNPRFHLLFPENSKLISYSVNI